MLEINLLPPELRKKGKTKIALPTQGLWYIAPLALGLLVIIHLYLALAILVKSSQYKSLNAKWLANRSSQEKVADWKKEFNLANQDIQDIIRLNQQRIVFSDKLKITSEVLPDGIWFNQLEVRQKSFSLQGSVVSLENEHMSSLREFLDKLKNDKDFYTDFSNLELGPVKMREYKGYKLMDFVLEGNLK